MSALSHRVFGLACLLASVVPVTAQQPLSLQIRGGQVTLRAENVPLRTILLEWARVGGTNIVGGDRLAGAPVTLELTDVPERQALDVLLRGVSGYVLAMRPDGVQGASVYNRILIMPPSTAPRALPAPTVGAAPRLPQLSIPEAADGDVPGVVLEGPGGQVRPGPAVRVPAANGPLNVPGQGGQAPVELPVPDTSAPVSPQTPGVVVTPGNPFGLPPGSSSSPGTVAPAPPQQQPGQRP